MKIKLVEQVSSGKVTLSTDRKKSSPEIKKVLSQFGIVQKIYAGYALTLGSCEFTCLIKNVTYLGHPHPIYKKRIQIPSRWSSYIQDPFALLIGIYSGPTEDLIVLFCNNDFANKSLNNSSAHVSVNELLTASVKGYSSKVDQKGNFIQVFNISRFNDFLIRFANSKSKIQNIHSQKIFYKEYSHSKIPVIQPFVEYGNHILNSTWHGIKAYDDMVLSRYSKALEAEWQGWYNEFLFEKFLIDRGYNSLIRMHPKDTDFDLLIEDREEFYGDLKTHASSSSAILGNDLRSLENAIKYKKRVWLIVIFISVKKDAEYGYIVRDHWNSYKTKLNKGNSEASYSNRMKHSVEICNFAVLEINEYNIQYIDVFKQGKQADGSPREVKFQIRRKNIDNFLIFST